MSTGIVIGATGGIGAACARRLAHAVSSVVVSDRSRDSLPRLAAELGGRAIPVEADICTADGRTAIAAAVPEPIAWVVLASGVPLRKPLTDSNDEEIAATFQTNLVAPVLLLRRLLGLRWDAGASVVVVGSISAVRALPRRAVYGASKAGLEHLARSLAAELAPREIRVNVVSPGVIATAFLGEDTAALQDWVLERVPAARVGDAEEVADVVRYLALEAPSFVTGARFVVDGGAETIA